MRKPSVAAINGYALGGGLELAMCCTVRIASHDARARPAGSEARACRPATAPRSACRDLVGRGRALEMLLSAEPVSAAEAHRIGLVNHVVEAANELLRSAAPGWARCWPTGRWLSGLTMQAVDAGLDCGMDAGLRFEAMAFGLAAASQDRAEGTRAFLEKRAPVFTGK